MRLPELAEQLTGLTRIVADWAALPLFPLRTVLFPGGLLGLKVFEARYLDMVSACLRTAANTPRK